MRFRLLYEGTLRTSDSMKAQQKQQIRRPPLKDLAASMTLDVQERVRDFTFASLVSSKRDRAAVAFDVDDDRGRLAEPAYAAGFLDGLTSGAIGGTGKGQRSLDFFYDCLGRMQMSPNELSALEKGLERTAAHDRLGIVFFSAVAQACKR